MDSSSESDVEHTEEFFEFDDRGYLFEPEFTDEELLAQDVERTAQTREQAEDAASRARCTVS